MLSPRGDTEGGGASPALERRPLKRGSQSGSGTSRVPGMGRGSRRGGSGPGRRAGGGGSAFSPAHAYGSDLLLWLRDNQGVTLSTVGEWKDQSPSGLLFAQATQAARPAASGGGADFDGTNDFLAAGYGVAIAPGAVTVGTDAKLDALPGVASGMQTHLFPQSISGGGLWCGEGRLNIVGYQPRHFTAQHGNSGLGVGVADALTTDRERTIFTHDGITATANPAGYQFFLQGAAKTVVASGATGYSGGTPTFDVAAIGALARPTPLNLFNGKVYQVVVYSSVLSGAGIAAFDALLASGTATYADYAALGTVAWCLLPGVGQSGDVSAWADQGPAGNNMSQATLANQPYFDLDDSVGDLRPSVIADGTADYMATVGDVAAFAGATKMTWSCWFRKPATSCTIFTQADLVLADIGWLATTGITPDRAAFYVPTSGADLGTSAIGNFSYADTWVHVCWVFDGAGAANADRLKLYRNGAPVSLAFSGTIPAALRDSAAPTSLFGYAGGSNFAGRIDDALIIKRALTPAQVMQLATYYTRSG